MSVPAIKLTNVTKKYGSSRGVTDLSLTVPRGEVFGFIGPNGAGKTTTIRMLLDFIRPSKGTIEILGMDSKHDAVKIHKNIGYLSGDMEMDRRLTGKQYLEYMAHLRGGVEWATVEKLIQRLDCQTDKKMAYLSRGNKQKIGLITALMHDPDLLILDEPTSGLDPLIQVEFQKLIAEHRDRGKTALISSHVLSEVQQVCDHIGFIRDGQLLKVQPLKILQEKAFKNVHVRLSKPAPKALAHLRGVTDLQITHTDVTCKFNGNCAVLLHALSLLPIEDITIEEPGLDDLFMDYYKDPAAETQDV